MTTPNNTTHGAADAALSFSTTPSSTMNYTTHNQTNIQYNYTSLQGYVDAGYDELVNLFGQPMEGDKYKVDAEWVLRFEDNVVATIYNYKNGKNYNGDEGLAKEQIRDWHIGGHEKNVVDRVQIILDLHRETKEEAAPESRDKAEQALDSAMDIMVMLRNVKGNEYATTVESGLIAQKQIDMVNMLLGILVKVDAMPESVADIMQSMFAALTAKQISLTAKNGKVTTGGEKDAKEIMQWVEKIMDREQDAAKAIIAMAEKDEGGE